MLKAQDGKASMTVDNSTVNIAAGTTEMRFSEGIYFGPNANWEVNGTLEIWSKNIWIAPGATFNGSGRIIVYNPGNNPFYLDMPAGPTNIDGNNSNFINLLIEHRNTDNIILADLTDPGYGTTNPAGALSATLNIGNDLDLATDRANIILNGHNLAFNTVGKLSNYSANRMVITGNSIAGHVIKEYAGSEPFVFPVGIAALDYTPATIRSEVAGKIGVSVQNYAGSHKRYVKPESGMDRTWHLAAPIPLKASITLQHNANTNGALFKDVNASIERFDILKGWDVLKSINPSTGIHASSSVTIGGGAIGEWFTKLATATVSLALKIPNLFTPNGDGRNDTFEIRGIETFAQNDLLIVNRWGNEVFKQGNYRNTWTGNGLNEGTYYYILRVKETANSDWQVFTGDVMLAKSFNQ